MAAKKSGDGDSTAGGGGVKQGAENRKPGTERRSGRERRAAIAEKAPTGEDRRLADRRTGLERRRPHLHYEDLTPHPRPERNINDYPLSTDEVEFINAINDYKDKFGRPFPTWSEVLHVLRTLGYIRYDTPIPAILLGHGPFGAPPDGADAGEAPKTSS